MSSKKVAILYDFDNTLSVKSMQEYGLFDKLNWTTEIFAKNFEQAQKFEMDRLLSFLYLVKQRADELGITLKKQDLVDCGKNIEYFPGVLTWFERINAFGKMHNIEVEHYIVSSGHKEIIEGSKIYKHFKKVFACEYLYDQYGKILWPKVSINYTNKTQFIFRINKGILNLHDDSINEYMDISSRPITYENMIYIGDGFTDVPCMKLLKQKQGKSFAVYTESNKAFCETLIRDNRVSNIFPADYSENSLLENAIKEFILSNAQESE